MNGEQFIGVSAQGRLSSQGMRSAGPALSLRRVALLAGLTGLVIFVAVHWFEQSRSTKASPIMPITPVSVSLVKKGTLDLYLSQIGTVTSLATVSIKSRIAGQIMQLGFREGQMVDRGQPLFTIDSRPYKAELDQYRGQLARDQGTLVNARKTLERYNTLLEQGVIAKQDRDNQQALFDQARGAVENDRGLIEAANVDLGYCSITSPIRGRIGLRAVDLGNYVQTTDTLAVITQLQPISVIFSVPEDNIPAIAQTLASDQRIPVEAWNRDFTQHLADGYLLTFDNVIDQSTGTVKLRAQFPNDNYGLFPDEFVNARLRIKSIRDALLVPTAALQRTQHGTFLYVAQNDRTVVRRQITIQATQGDITAIASGLNPGEMVIRDGLDKLRSGSRIDPQVVVDTPAMPTPSA